MRLLPLATGVMVLLPVHSAVAQVYGLEWLGGLYKTPTLDGPMTRVATVIAPSNKRYNSLAFDASTGWFVSVQGSQDLLEPSALVWFDQGGVIRRSLNVAVASQPTSDIAMGLSFGPNGQLYATLYRDPSLYRIDVITGEMTFVQSLAGFTLDLAILPDGTMFRSALRGLGGPPADFSGAMFNPLSGRFENEQVLPMNASPRDLGYQALTSLSDGRLLGSSPGQLRIIDPTNSSELPIPGFGFIPNDLRGMAELPAPGAISIVVCAGTLSCRRRRQAK